MNVIGGDMLDAVRALPDHLRDALWRIETARAPSRWRPQPRSSAAWAARRSAATSRRPRLATGSPSRCWSPAATSCPPGRRPGRPCSARATRATPRRRSPATPRPRRWARSRLVATTGGELADAARRDGVPVIGLPAGSAAARGRRLHVLRRGRARGPGRRRTAPPHRDRRRGLAPGREPAPPPRSAPASSPREIGDAALVIYGSDLTAPGRLPLEVPGEREREAARLRVGAAGGRPQRDRGLGRLERAASPRSSWRTATSIRASAGASS